jgi:hypothetical protein
MTIQREHKNGPFVIQCDECTETVELQGYEFAEALADAKDQGFVSINNKGTWQHHCKQCADD